MHARTRTLTTHSHARSRAHTHTHTHVHIRELGGPESRGLGPRDVIAFIISVTPVTSYFPCLRGMLRRLLCLTGFLFLNVRSKYSIDKQMKTWTVTCWLWKQKKTE